MPIPFEQDCSPQEFLNSLLKDLKDDKVSAFLVIVDYENQFPSKNLITETLMGAKNSEKYRLIALLPGLQDVLIKLTKEIGDIEA